MNDEARPKTSLSKKLLKSIDHIGCKWNYHDAVRNTIQDTCSSKRFISSSKTQTIHHVSVALLWLLVAPTITGFFCICANSNFDFWPTLNSLFEQEACIVTKPIWLADHYTTKPTANCHSICKGLREIPALEKISSLEFLAKYAYSGRPLLLRNATNDWKAIENFGFPFFKRIFQSHAEKMAEKLAYNTSESNAKLSPEDTKLLEMCQFLQYRTKFRNLAEFLNISETESLENNYYIGWSNCFPEVLTQLRDQYSWPDFLPADSEASRLDWIFMGGSNERSGDGAPVHIDFIERPSWQAVITGAKKWILYPPAECENVCLTKYEVHMDRGDLLIIDTALWYHATKTYSGVLTISLGSEFD